MRTGTPIIVDIDGSGCHLTSAKEGVRFDFFGSGTPVQMAWTAKTSTNAFLVKDRDGNHQITTGAEMFGNLTEQPQSDDPNGFLALAVFDLNQDGWIDQEEAEKGQLLLWQDANHNGITEPSELHSFKELGVERISLHYHKDRHVDQFGNLFRYAAAIGDNSHDHRVYDVILRYVNH